MIYFNYSWILSVHKAYNSVRMCNFCWSHIQDHYNLALYVEREHIAIEEQFWLWSQLQCIKFLVCMHSLAFISAYVHIQEILNIITNLTAKI